MVQPDSADPYYQSVLMRRVSLRLDALREDEDHESDTSEDSGGESDNQDDKSLFSLDRVLDPEGEAVYIWMGLVSCCVLYNTWVIILRTAFEQMRSKSYLSPYLDVLDVLVDLVYLADIAVHFRIGYLEDGILVTDLASLSSNYRSQPEFLWDVVSILPVKLVTLLLPLFDGPLPIMRLPRLLKWGTVLEFFQITDSRTSRPNILRAMVLILYLASFIHWIACLYYMLSEYEGLGANEWVYPGDRDEQPFIRKYIRCMYWSTMTLTTIGENPPPRTNLEYIFTGLTYLVGVFLFATVVGNVGDVISNLRHARAEFQARLDRVKMYLNHHSVPHGLQTRVKKWADYVWNRTQAMDDSTFLEMLPKRLRKEIAIHVHLDTLKKVKIFEDCENGMLCDLALKLRSQVYTPGDYVCKTGEIGREMYIISHGKLKVFVQETDTGQPLEVATLREGNYFGEISLLKLDDGCNRRSADVMSVGYSELLCLSKKDLIQTLAEYPEARKVLEDQGRDRIKESRMQRRKSDAGAQFDSSDLKSKFPARRTTSLPTRSSSGVNKCEDISEIILQLKTLDSLVTRERIQQLSEKMDKLTEMLNQRSEQLQTAATRIGELERMLQGRKKKRRRSSVTLLTSSNLNLLLSPERGGEKYSHRATGRDDRAATLRVDDLRRRFRTRRVLAAVDDDMTDVDGHPDLESPPRGDRNENFSSDGGRAIPEISINGVIHQELCGSPWGEGPSLRDDEEDIPRLSVSSGSSHDLGRLGISRSASCSSDLSSSMVSDSLYSDTCYDTDYSFYRE